MWNARSRGGSTTNAFRTPRKDNAAGSGSCSSTPSTPALAINNSEDGKQGPRSAEKSRSTLHNIQKIERMREQRRKQMAEYKQAREEESLQNDKLGRPGDVDFQRMIRQYRDESGAVFEEHDRPGEQRICICVRKRPISEKEIKKKDHEAVTCRNPTVVVHDCKLRVDGITKFLDNSHFAFDHTFHEEDDNESVYLYTAKHLTGFIFEKGRATVFAYGQTGSGKTYTMAGIQQLAAQDIFRMLDEHNWGDKLDVFVSFFEIYGGRCQDLLSRRQRLDVREDGRGEVQISGLFEQHVKSVDEILQVIDRGNRSRTTHATEQNDTSSRSHGICQIALREKSSAKLFGKLSLIDLAGSERAQDSRHHNRQRRLESADINKSLLALKECIRALDSGGQHVPYRASKLTLVLKDSFTMSNARTVMIATISPCSSSSDHTLNTLRYAYRIKEKRIELPESRPVTNPSSFAAAPVAPLSTTEKSSGEKNERSNLSPSSQILGHHRDRARYLSNYGNKNELATLADTTCDDTSEGELVLPDDLQHEISGMDDIKFLHDSLKRYSGGNDFDNSAELLEQLHEAVQTIYQEEEELLNEHMNAIQENAELLTEEGQLLANVQGEGVVDYDIDAYAARLEEILERRIAMTRQLRKKVKGFRRRLQEEEHASKQIERFPLF